MAEPAGAIVANAASAAKDLAELLANRSPGARTQAELTKHARVASKVRTHPKLAAHPTAPDAPSTSALVDLLQPPVVPVEIASAELPPSLAQPPTLGAILNSMPGFTPPGGSSGGGSASFPSVEPREAVPPASAVPEPGTWAMMLMGFGLIAWRVRRRRPSLGIARRSAL